MCVCPREHDGILLLQDEGQRSKTGLAASKMQLDAKPMQADILGRALAGNQKIGVATALLQARTPRTACLAWAAVCIMVSAYHVVQ